jgi:hypothetical protein
MHPFDLLFISTFNTSLLLRTPHILLFTGREPVPVIVVHTVHAVGPAFVEIDARVREMAEIGRERVSIEEDDVIGVDFVDRCDAAIIPVLKTRVCGVSGFV